MRCWSGCPYSSTLPAGAPHRQVEGQAVAEGEGDVGTKTAFKQEAALKNHGFSSCSTKCWPLTRPHRNTRMPGESGASEQSLNKSSRRSRPQSLTSCWCTTQDCWLPWAQTIYRETTAAPPAKQLHTGLVLPSHPTWLWLPGSQRLAFPKPQRASNAEQTLQNQAQACRGTATHRCASATGHRQMQEVILLHPSSDSLQEIK